MGLFNFKKKTNMFDKHIEPKCAYCEHGKPARSEGKVLCPRCGIVDMDYSCKKFVYSPFLRIPERKKPEAQSAPEAPAPEPETSAAVAEEVIPAEPEPVAEPEPAPEPEPESEPVAEPAKPKKEIPYIIMPSDEPEEKPAPEKKPAAEAHPAPERKPAAEVRPAPERKPAAEVRPAPERKPAAEARPAPEKKPAAEARPAPERKPAAEARPAPAKKPAPNYIKREAPPSNGTSSISNINFKPADNSAKIAELEKVRGAAVSSIENEVAPKVINLPQTAGISVSSIANEVAKRNSEEYLGSIAAAQVASIENNDTVVHRLPPDTKTAAVSDMSAK